MHIYQSSAYRKDLSCYTLTMSERFKRNTKWRTKSHGNPFLWLIQQLQVATRNTSPDMSSVFHAWSHGKSIEIQSNLRRKKLHRTKQGSKYLGGNFSNRNNVKSWIQFRRKIQPSILNNYFSSRIDPSIVTSITSLLLDWSNNTSLVLPALKSTNYFLLQCTVPSKSDSSSEANSSFCHWSYA